MRIYLPHKTLFQSLSEALVSSLRYLIQPNSEPLDKYKFASGLSVEAVIVEEPKLAELRTRYQDGNGALAEGLDESFDLRS